MSLRQRSLPAFPEVWLQRVWKRPALYRMPLRTADGQLVRVLDAGSPNDGDGPDYLNATLLINETPQRGDVEFHFRSADWYRHRHHTDPRYERVILHVALDHPADELSMRHDAGVRIPTVDLTSHLRVPLGTLPRLLAESTDQRACPLPDGMPSPAQRAERLDDLGEVRLLKKAERFHELCAAVGDEEAFYRMLADALGFAENRAPFAKLVERVPLESLRRLSALNSERLLLRMAGFTPSRASMEGPEPLAAHEWKRSRAHPGNDPYGRVVGLARLAERYRTSFYPPLIEAVWESDLTRSWLRRWERFFVAGDDGKKVVGESQAKDIWVNVALPALIVRSETHGDEALRERVIDLYRTHPSLQSNRRTRWVAEHVLRDESADRGALAAGQQGMIELRTLFCEPKRCAECPLTDSPVPSRGATAVRGTRREAIRRSGSTRAGRE